MMPLWLFLNFIAQPEIDICRPTSRSHGRLGSPLAVEALRREWTMACSWHGAASHIIIASAHRFLMIAAFLGLCDRVLTWVYLFEFKVRVVVVEQGWLHSGLLWDQWGTLSGGTISPALLLEVANLLFPVIQDTIEFLLDLALPLRVQRKGPSSKVTGNGPLRIL